MRCVNLRFKSTGKHRKRLVKKLSLTSSILNMFKYALPANHQYSSSLKKKSSLLG